MWGIIFDVVDSCCQTNQNLQASPEFVGDALDMSSLQAVEQF
jgi:hypothetical protein